MKKILALIVLSIALVCIASCASQDRLPKCDQYGVRTVGVALGQFPVDGYNMDSEYVIRLTFAPAFDPEFSVTITQKRGGPCEVEVVSFTSNFGAYIYYQEHSDHYFLGPEEKAPARPEVRRVVGHLADAAAIEFRKKLKEIRPQSMKIYPTDWADNQLAGLLLLFPTGNTV